MWAYTVRHAIHEGREEDRLKPEDLELRCVDIAGHRVYAIFYQPTHVFGVMYSWGNPGVGLSIRGAEQLLKGIDSLKEVPIESTLPPPTAQLPEPTWTPESEAHDGLRKRVAHLVNRAPAVDRPSEAQPSSEDVFVYPTGMAAIYHSSNRAQEYRPGTIVLLGTVFHSTHHHFTEDSPNGFKHVGKVDEQSINEFEEWLDEQAKQSKPVSYVFVEFPGNPTLDTPDLFRLKKLSEKHNFILAADDTISSFANVDLLSQCDILITSLTKSFSGMANVMGGSTVLNPSSPHYKALSPLFTKNHRNELFGVDAEVLLSNSQEFFDRCATYNKNAQAVATFLADKVADPDCPLVKVRYPSMLPSKSLYDKFKRQSTAQFPEPGYGCLLNLDFEDVDSAIAFHDNCGFYPSPHLGAHVTIKFAYTMVVFGKKPEERASFSKNGAKEESVRISVGLEKVEDIIETFADGLDKATALKKNGYKKQE